jgi:hypothetical protein
MFFFSNLLQHLFFKGAVSRDEKLVKVLKITSAFSVYALNAATSIFKRVSVRIFKISKCLHTVEANKNFNFCKLRNKAQRKIINHWSIYRKYGFDF